MLFLSARFFRGKNECGFSSQQLGGHEINGHICSEFLKCGNLQENLYYLNGPSMFQLLNTFSIHSSVGLSADLRQEAAKWALFVSLLTVTVAGCSWKCVLW